MTERAVSVTLNYVLGLGVATILIGGLLMATGGIIEDRQESAIRSELRVIGERVSGNLAMADRLAQTTGTETVVVESPAPRTVAGKDYSIAVNDSAEEVVVETEDPDVTVRVPFRSTTQVADSTASGGDIDIVLNSAGELEVRST